MSQDERKAELLRLCREYNDSQPEGWPRLVLQTHDFHCRCATCWYEYGGAARAERYPEAKWHSLEAQLDAERSHGK